ncbi:MAG: hypothetical protein HY303_12700 [Candidatus Wallbacteria bacterium]|nr:hypothetical protein [Candidatus Wallbacteria bacterium]
MMLLPLLRRALLGVVSFQLASGIVFWRTAAPGAATQAAVLLHMVLGTAAALLLGPYLKGHLPRVWKSSRRWMRVLGLGAATSAATALATGLAMGAMVTAGSWVPKSLAFAHRWAGLSGGALLVAHLGGAARKPAGRGALRECAAGLAIGLALAAAGTPSILWMAVRTEPSTAADPAGGALSTTRRVFEFQPPPSEACGTSGCHEQIYREWRAGPHGNAGADPYYLALETKLRGGPAAARTSYCNECHDPELLLTGRLSARRTGGGALVAHTGESVACYVCHSMRETGGKKERGNYAVEPPSGGFGADTAIGRFLIRAWPESHHRAFWFGRYEKYRVCSACHLATVDEPIPGFGNLWIENPFERWELAGVKPRCHHCHMPDRKSPDGEHPSHRFAGSNLFPGADDVQRAAVESMFRGEAGLRDVKGNPSAGALFELSAGPVRATSSGVEIPLAIADQGRIGHQFPAGAQDLCMVWIEADWADAAGRPIARWGEVEAGGPLLPWTPMFRRPGAPAADAGRDHLQPFGLLRPGETMRVELRLPGAVPTARIAGSRLQATFCYRKVSSAALGRLGPGPNGLPLALPPRRILARLDVPLRPAGN